jgi:uncharacterized protein (TIGR00288 family)
MLDTDTPARAVRRVLHLQLRIVAPGAKKPMRESASPSPVALLIDGENMVSDQMPQILDEAGKLGEVTIRRVYGNWTTYNFHRHWSDSAIKYALEPVHHIEAKSGGNGSDIALVIGAMDILHNHTIKHFCLVTSDSDYTPLVMRLRAGGCTVYGIGKPNTPEILKNAYTKFISTGELGAAPIEHPGHESHALADVFQLTDLFIKAYRASLALISYNDGWVPIQLLGKQLMRLDQGYREPFGNMNLTTLIKKRPDLFEIQLRSPNSQIEVRLRSQASGAPTASTE